MRQEAAALRTTPFMRVGRDMAPIEGEHSMSRMDEMCDWVFIPMFVKVFDLTSPDRFPIRL